MPTPTVVSVSVDGGQNAPDGPDGVDGEVQLAMVVAGAVAPRATYRIYFDPNLSGSFLTALKQAVAECNGVSISTWGLSENNRLATKMDEFEAVIKSARAQGIPVFVAAGDTASED